MTIGESIRTHALADAGIAAAIGTRMYPVAESPDPPKDGPMPDTVVYSQESEEIEQFISGDDLWAKTLYQFLIICDPRQQVGVTTSAYARAQSISDLLLARFHGYRGTMGGAGGIDVQQVFQTDRADSLEFEVGFVMKRQQFEITWRI